MPTFNKGTFKHGGELIEYDARPIKGFKISSIRRWDKPYAPGDAVEFTLSLKGVGGTFAGVQILARQNGGQLQWVANFSVKKTKETYRVPATILSGQGSIDYYMRSLGFPDPTILLASVEPTHNDTWMVLIAGGIITGIISLGCVIVAWLLGLFQVTPYWRLFIK